MRTLMKFLLLKLFLIEDGQEDPISLFIFYRMVGLFFF